MSLNIKCGISEILLDDSNKSPNIKELSLLKLVKAIIF